MGTEAGLHSFLTSALDGGGSAVIPSVPTPVPLRSRLGEPYSRFARSGEISCPWWQTDPIAQSLQWLIYIKTCGRETCCEDGKRDSCASGQGHVPRRQKEDVKSAGTSALHRLHLYHADYICTTQITSAPHRLHLHRADYICTAQTASAPRRLHLHHKDYICTTQITSALQRLHLHHADYICTTKITSEPRRLHLHHTDYICTTQITSAPRRLHLHHADYICTTQITSTPHRLHLHCTDYICTTQITSALRKLQKHESRTLLRTLPKNLKKSSNALVSQFRHVDDRLFTPKTVMSLRSTVHERRKEFSAWLSFKTISSWEWPHCVRKARAVLAEKQSR
jgi:hypothetical protein